MAKRKIKAPAKRGANNKNGGFLAKEITSLILAAFALIFILSIWFKSGGPFGAYITKFLQGMFGDAAFLLPLVISFAMFSIYFYKSKLKLKLWLIAFFPMWVSMFMQLVYRLNNSEFTFGIDIFYENGTKGIGGGVIGGVTGDPLFSMTGRSSFVIAVLIILVMIVLFFEISVIELLKKMIKGSGNFIKSLKEAFDNFDEEEEEVPAMAKKEKKKKEISLPLEEEIVIHNPLDGEEVFEKEEEKTDKLPDFLTRIQEDENSVTQEPVNETDGAKPPEEENVNETDRDDEGEFEIEKKIIPAYIPPHSDLLEQVTAVASTGKIEQLKASAQKLLDILESYGIEARITNIVKGASVTRYEILPASGVKVNKITALDQDIALRLPASNVRMEVQSGSIGIEVSNESVSMVTIREIIESAEFKNHPSRLAVALGKDIEGKTVVMDVAKTPHLLIAGATGSGKSVCINTIITSILYKASPEEVKFVMVDPKKVELGMYNGIPHLLVPIVTDPRKAAGALCWAVQEMEDRYKKFSEKQARDLAGYNNKMQEEEGEKLPQIVIIIDELSDLMMVAPGEVQDYICRLAQMARAAGMHLVLATQRPSVDVITGIIKINIPSRIAFSVASQVDSRTILDGGGAEKLMGKGDMLFMMTGSKMRRVQGAFISDKDVENVTNFVKAQSECAYSENVAELIETKTVSETSKDEDGDSDELLDQAAEVAFELNQISASMLQRRLKVGYARAGRLIDILEKKKVISPYDGTNKPRQMTMGRSEYLEMRNR